MRFPRPTSALAALLCLLVAGPAHAARRGQPERASGGVAVTTAELNGDSLGRIPRREQPEEHQDRPPPKATDPGSPRTAGVRTSTHDGVMDTALTSPSSFEGPNLHDALAYPPDSQGAVGPTQFVVMINGRVRSYSKLTGQPDGQLDTDTDVFWQAAMTTGGGVTSNFTSDPHIRYDRLSGHWFAVMIDVPNDGAMSNRIMVAVSETATITSSTVWHFFHFDAPSLRFADYPTLGVDANALYIGTNDFTLAGNFANCSVYVVRKTSLIGNDGNTYTGPMVVTPFTNVINGSNVGPYTPQGVDNPAPSAATGYFVGVDNAVFGQLDVLPVSNPGATPTLGTMVPVTVPRTQYPKNVPFLGAGGGAAAGLDALDDRLFAAQIRNGHLWTAHNVGVVSDGTSPATQPGPFNPSDRVGSRWYDLSLSGTPSLTKSGTIFDPSGASPRSFWIPSLAVSGQGTMAIGGTTASAAARPDAWFSSLQPGDGAAAAPTRYTSASADYSTPSGNNRWGDYSLTTVDPNDDQTMWTIQEYVTSTDTWGTRIAKLLAPAPAAPTAIAPASVPLNQPSVHVTISAPAGAGWFDPGAGFPNRFAVSNSCGLPMSNVVLTNANTVDLDLNTSGFTHGACDVTVTNPDGQTGTAQALISDDARPVANPDTYSLTGGAPFNGTGLLANDTDADPGDTLTAIKASDPAHGSVTVASDGSFTYTPAAGFSGDDGFTYRASDSFLASTPAAVTLHVAPATPGGGGTTTTPTTTTPATTDTKPTPTPTPVTAKPCIVPRLRGLRVRPARRALLKAHCRAGRIRHVLRAGVRRGRVVSSTPAPGRRLANGARVALVVRTP